MSQGNPFCVASPSKQPGSVLLTWFKMTAGNDQKFDQVNEITVVVSQYQSEIVCMALNQKGTQLATASENVSKCFQ